MATVIRGPVFVGRRDFPLQVPSPNNIRSLNETTLTPPVVSLLPQNAGRSIPLQVQQPWLLSLNANTSRGIPKTLQVEIRTLPFQTVPEFPVTQANNKFLNGDTSQGLPQVLRPVTANPQILNSPQTQVAFLLRINANTSAGMPKTLIDDTVFVASIPESLPLIRYPFGVVDTSFGTALVLRNVVAASPVINNPNQLVIRVLRNNPDTSKLSWPIQFGAGVVTGSSSTTNNNDTSAAAGTTTIVGTLARTNNNDTSAASGTTTIVGTSSTTNANDTLAASGTVGGSVSGSSSTTNANDTSAASGTTTIVGTLSTTNANDTSVAAGTTTILGTLARTNNNDTLAATGFPGFPSAVNTRLPLTGAGF